MTRYCTALLLFCSFALPATGQSFGDPKFSDAVLGHVWADQPSSGDYVPLPLYAYNAAGGAVTITSPAVGTYAVRFEGLGSSGLGGHVQATAYGSGANYCGIAGWNPDGSDLVVQVRCRDASGTLVDSEYDVVFLSEDAGAVGQLAYAWANDPTAASYTPSSVYSYNGTGEAITATRTGPGDYQMLFTGLTQGGGHVQVTAYGGDHRCGTGGWVFNGDALEVRVACYDPDGNLADGLYTVMYLGNEGPGSNDAFAWANDPGADSYTPTAGFSVNGAGGEITATRSAVGTYAMTFAGLGGAGIEGGNAQATSYFAGSISCRVLSWASDGDDVTISVGCSDVDGNPTDARYNLLFTWPDRPVTTAGEAGAPDRLLRLAAPAPNPVTATTVLRYQLDQAGAVRLAVYDLLGREVEVVEQRQRAAGDHTVAYDAAGLPAGVYLVRLETERGMTTRRFTVLR